MTGPRIVLLGKDSSSLAVMHALLIEEGYRTLRYRPQDVADVHALIKRCQPALVILDRWWRSGDGWEFLKHLWAAPQTTHIGVVLTAGQTVGPPLQAEMFAAMQCQVVQTPLDQHEVLRAIAAVHDPSSLRRIPERRVAAVSTVPPVHDEAGVRFAHTGAGSLSPETGIGGSTPSARRRASA